jgi:autotransporter-associated beta strand protein
LIGVAGLVALAASSTARAQNATWLATPGSGNFDAATNWSPAAVPTGVASFGASNVTSLSFSTNTTIGGLTLNAGASNYVFTISPPYVLTFAGAGIAINGGAATIDNNNTLNFNNASSAGSASIDNDGLLAFANNSTASNANIDNLNTVTFSDASTAGAANITNVYKLTFNGDSTAGNANIVNTVTGGLGFYDSSTAANSTITSNYLLGFYDTSTAGNATITNNKFLYFYDTSTAGNATITNSYYLSFNNNSTAGASTIVNQSGAETDFFGNSNAGQAQLIAQAGAVVDFSGSAGPSGNGVITVGSIAGAGDFYLGANNLIVGGNDLSTTVSGVISDCGPTGAECNASPATLGSLTKVGSGVLTLTGANTYTGATTIDTGSTLALAGTGSISTSGNVADNGFFSIAGLTNGGTSITSLSGGGVVTLGANTLALSNASGVFSGAIGGTGGLTLDAGAETLTGANTYSGATTIDTGSTLALTGTGSISSSNVADNGLFSIAGLTNGGTSIASLSGGGGVTLGANTLALSNASGVFSGAIGGAGGLTLNAGHETLTGVSAYSGATAINGGTLEVDGSIASNHVGVNSGGELTGIGVIDPTAVTINSGGTFAPGAAGQPGTSMTIYGSLAFNSGATYEVYLNPSTSTLAKVMGPASLAGEVLADFTPGAYVAKKYTILTATGGLGGTTFSSLAEIDAPAGFAETLTYDADDVYLDLTSTLGSTPGLNVNQRNVANGLGNAFNNGASLPPAFANVFGLSGQPLGGALTQLSGEAAVGARQGAFLLDDMFLTLMLDPYVENRGGGIGEAGSFGAGTGCSTEDQAPSSTGHASATRNASTAESTLPCAPHWTVWGAAFGGGASISGVASIGSHDTSSVAGGFAAGADYHISPDAMLGFAIAGGGDGWSLSQGLGGGRSDVFQVGVYGVHDFGPAYVAAALDASNYWTTTNRTVTLPGGSAYAANFEAQSFGARLESGYRIPLTALTLTPYGALQAISFQAPAYAESAGTGGPGFALNYAGQSAADTRLELGAWADTTFALADGDALKLFGRAAYVHDWQNNPAVTATFEDLPTASFVVNGARPAPNQGLIAVGAEWRFAKNWTLMAKFQGEFGVGFQSYNAAARLSYVW